jgi:hypothetical protein
VPCSSSRIAIVVSSSPSYPCADVGVSDGFGRGVNGAISSLHGPRAGFSIDASMRF